MIKKRIEVLGQSTIEFIMTFSLVVGFVFLFFKTALNYTDGFLVHFATYMAARSYLVVDPNRDKAADGDSPAFNYAKGVVFNKYMGGLINNFDGVIKDNAPGIVQFAPYIGLYTTFHEKFSAGYVGGTEVLEFRSEAFLGREPNRTESNDQVCAAISAITGSNCETETTLDDNGG